MIKEKNMHSDFLNKLDGVGPVDNRLSTDKLHQFVCIFVRDTQHVTHDTWQVTHDMHGVVKIV